MIKFLSFLLLICFAEAQTEIQHSQAQIGSHRSVSKNVTKPHQSATAQHTTSTHQQNKKAETCPRNCVEAVHALDQVYHLRQQIEQAKHAQNPHYAMKAINQTKIQGSGQHCQADCAQVKGIQRQIEKYQTDLAKIKATPPQNQKAETCPRNCVEAVHALDQVYHLRQQIEQAKHAQNPHYAMKAINQTKIQSSGQHCQADCAQVKGIQRQIEKYQTDLAKIKATPPQNQKTTALVVHQGKTNHQEPPSATSPTQSHHDSQEQCPKNCKQEGMMLRQIVKYERDIETQKHRLDPHYKVRQIQDVDMSKYATTCHVDCPHILDLRRQHSDLRTQLDHLKDKQPTQSSSIVPHQPVATGTCPKNCHEAWTRLQEAYKLRQEIEQTKHAHNPQYAMKQIKAPTMQDSGQSCHADCPQVKGIQREVDKYKAELTKLKADHTQTNQSTAIVPHQPVATGTCPKNCHEAWYYLQEVYKLRQEIEQTKHAHNPQYAMKQIKAPTMQDSGQSCHADCPQVKGIQREVDKYKAELTKLKDDHTQTNQSTAIVPHQPVATGTCPKNCHEAWYYLQEVYKLRQEIEQTKHAHNPQYAMKQIKAPTMQDSGQSCHADCPQVKGIQREVDKYKAELTKLKDDHTSAINPTQPQKPSLRIPQQEVAAGTCPKNCHEAWYYLHEIHDVRQQIEQAKYAKNPSYQMQTIKAPTMQDSTQHCHGDCPQVIGIQRQLKKYQDELAAISAGNALPAPQQGLKGQCKPGCDNETALRIEIQNLNKKLDQLKHKADPSYRIKTYKPISTVKTGVTCPAGCNNLKQLEKRKAQLNQAITQMQSSHPQPIVTEPDDDQNALTPYTGGNTDGDYTGPDEEVTDQPQKPKKKGLISRLKTKASGAVSAIKNQFKKKPSSSGSNNALVPYDNDDSTGGALVPYDDNGLDDDYNQSLQPTPPSSGGYDPYGTDDDLDYSQGYGYNQNSGNYNTYNDPYDNQMVPYDQNYGYNPYGSSSTTHEESGPMYPNPYASGEVFHSDQTDNQSTNANTAAAAMTAFGSILSGLLSQQPAATVPAQQPAISPAPAPQQQISPQNVVPQDDGDLDDLYGGSGDYASTTGSSGYGSSNYGSSSYSSNSYSNPSSSSYGSRSYSSPSSSSYSSNSYSNPSNSSYGSSGTSYNSRNSSSSYGSGYNSSSSGYDSDYDY